MKINQSRIKKAQELMKEQGMLGLMIMTRDDYQYFFGDIRVQPRAIIPVEGPVDLVAFSGEEPELTAAIGDDRIRVFRSVGGQQDIRIEFASWFHRFGRPGRHSQILSFHFGRIACCGDCAVGVAIL